MSIHFMQLSTHSTLFLYLVLISPLLFYVERLQVPEFEEAAFTAPLNKVVKCKTQFGWHLLQVLSERYSIV